MTTVEKTRTRRTMAAWEAKMREEEKRRLVMESIVVACHGMKRSSSMLTSCLHLVELRRSSPELLDVIEQCRVAAADFRDVLMRLRQVAAYGAETHRPGRTA